MVIAAVVMLGLLAAVAFGLFRLMEMNKGSLPPVKSGQPVGQPGRYAP
jgi:hypothetical protein